MRNLGPATPTARRRLRPGLPILRRDAHTLQVGLSRPLAVQLPDRPSVRRLLAALTEGTAPADPGRTVSFDEADHADRADEADQDAHRALAMLAGAGLLVDAGGGPPPSESDLLLFGHDASRRRTARTSATIGLTTEPGAAEGLEDLLDAAGLAVDHDTASVWLVVTAGPARRSMVDPYLRAGVPHLLVSGRDGVRRVGPFVEAGRTACVRCVDAHESMADPRLPFLIEQAAHPSLPHAPVDPLLRQLALAWAVRDLARYLEGDEPSTWSATVDIGASAAPDVTRWLRHPECGCAWDVMMHLP